MKISKKVHAEYLKNPPFCPSCKSNNIVAGEWDRSVQCQGIHCDDCGVMWREAFSMVSVEMVDGQVTWKPSF